MGSDQGTSTEAKHQSSAGPVMPREIASRCQVGHCAFMRRAGLQRCPGQVYVDQAPVMLQNKEL